VSVVAEVPVVAMVSIQSLNDNHILSEQETMKRV